MAQQLQNYDVRLSDDLMTDELLSPPSLHTGSGTSQTRCAGPVSDIMHADLRLDAGDRTFTILLQQLAQLYRNRLSELQDLREKHELHFQEPVGYSKNGSAPQLEDLQQAWPSTISTHSSVKHIGGDSHSNRAKDGSRCVQTKKDPLPPIELSVLPGAVKETDPNQDKCDDLVEILCVDAPEGIESIDHVDRKGIRITANSLTLVPFQLRDNWLNSGANHEDVTGLDTVAPAKRISTLEDEHALLNLYDGYLRYFILFPADPKRLVWDLSGAVLIFWDLVIIPLNFSQLTPKNSTFVDVMDWTTLIFWTLNMFASLTVGYVKDGIAVMSPQKILMNYLKTWFILDIIVVLPDWIFTLMNLSGNDSDAGESVKVLRILRLVRCVRLLRLAKLKAIMSSIMDLINSEYTSIVANIAKMMVALIAINHFIACMWYLAADSQTSVPTWIKVHGFEESTWGYQYLTSFHWGITQFTPSSMHVQPQNPVERTFAVFIVIFGLIGFSYLVGSITGSLAELRKMNSDTSKLFWNLRRYLKQNNVPRELKVRIQKYLEHKHQSMKVSISREQVTVLKHLSEQLDHELQCAITVPHILTHPLFKHLNYVSFVTMQRLATNAMSRKQLASGDSLFFPLEAAIDMSFVVAGRLQYIMRSTKEYVTKGADWISEPVLWTEWKHQGELVAECPCDLLLIHANQFANIIKRNPQVHVYVSAYAAKFLTWINHVPREHLSDIILGDLCTENVWALMENNKSPQKRHTGAGLGRFLTQHFTRVSREGHHF